MVNNAIIKTGILDAEIHHSTQKFCHSMKTSRLFFVVAIAFLSTFLTGCVVAVRPGVVVDRYYDPGYDYPGYRAYYPGGGYRSAPVYVPQTQCAPSGGVSAPTYTPQGGGGRHH